MIDPLLASTYLGGVNATPSQYSNYDQDIAYSVIAVGDSVYVGGGTDSADFPTTSAAFDRTYAGGADALYDTDAFISQLDMVSDGSGGTGGGNSNADPVADAGSDQTVGPNQTVTLNGSNSSDNDGSIVQYAWTQVSGKRVSLNNANSALASFVSPGVRRGKSKTLVFELAVTDNQGATATDQVTVVVSY